MKSLLPFQRRRPPPTIGFKKISVYLPPELEKVIVEMAKEERRSLSGQIVFLLSVQIGHRLEKGFKDDV